MEKNLHQILKFFVVSSLLLGTGHVITIIHIYKGQIDSLLSIQSPIIYFIPNSSFLYEISHHFLIQVKMISPSPKLLDSCSDLSLST